MCALIARSEKFEAIDPSHPLGGRDGKSDMLMRKNSKQYIGACFFPTGKTEFSAIKKKFKHDLEGIEKNKADGIAFFVNQHLTLNQRKELRKMTPFDVEIYHLERLTSLLNSPANYGVRSDFLRIDMTPDEITSVISIALETPLHTLSDDTSLYMPLLHQAYDHKANQQIIAAKLKEQNQNALKIFRGDIVLANIPNDTANYRPVIIVSNNIVNKYDDIMVIPLSSIIPKNLLPTHVILEHPMLRTKSVVYIEKMTPIKRGFLIKQISRVNSKTLKEINRGIMIHLGLL